ncbi:MAG: PilZ domain-containing protein [Deltaproteobacteria bacterium]|nr:PilZ domain-containing protein [Deltaproteobacteria bacterium]
MPRMIDVLFRWLRLERRARRDRLSPRYELVIYAPYGGQGPLVARRGNVGIGGFCIEGERQLTPGSRMELHFCLPGDHWIQVQGEVLGQLQCRGRIGVRGRFVDLRFADERRLARWLDSRTLGVDLSLAEC